MERKNSEKSNTMNQLTSDIAEVYQRFQQAELSSNASSEKEPEHKLGPDYLIEHIVDMIGKNTSEIRKVNITSIKQRERSLSRETTRENLQASGN